MMMPPGEGGHHEPSAGNIPPDAPPAVIQEIVKNEYLYAKIGLAVGAVLALAGVAMIFVGVTGPVDLSFGKVHLKTAVVGIVLAVIGAVIILATLPRISFAKKGKG